LGQERTGKAGRARDAVHRIQRRLEQTAAVYGAAFIGFCIAFAAAIFLSGELVDRLLSATNIPNKSYWLADGRRDDTLAFMRSWLRWLGVLTLGILTVIIDMGLRANLTAPPHFPDCAPWVLATSVSLTVAMIILFLWRFRVSTDY
jgi:hypothetical protein